MYCKEISQLLDERLVSELSAREKAELSLHGACCAECSGHYAVSAELEAFRTQIPPLPESLHARARDLEYLCEAKFRERRMRRPVLIGSLMLLGAAATLFAPVGWRDASASNR